MGSRATITIFQEDCYPHNPLNLYTHWDGHVICAILAQGLEKADKAGRLADSPYCTRIIFDTLTGLDGGTTGYGIIVGEHTDINFDSPVLIFGNDEPTVCYGELKMTATAFISAYAPDRNNQKQGEQLTHE